MYTEELHLLVYIISLIVNYIVFLLLLVYKYISCQKTFSIFLRTFFNFLFTMADAQFAEALFDDFGPKEEPLIDDTVTVDEQYRSTIESLVQTHRDNTNQARWHCTAITKIDATDFDLHVELILCCDNQNGHFLDSDLPILSLKRAISSVEDTVRTGTGRLSTLNEITLLTLRGCKCVLNIRTTYH